MKKVYVILMLSTSSIAMAEYKTEYYCDSSGYILKCTVGPYAHECEYTSQRCEDAHDNLKSIDARAARFQSCNAGMEKVFVQGESF